MIGISKLAKSFGGRTLFEGVTLQLNPGSRYGLVGANGSGKTTFLKIVAGDEQATDGQVNIPAQSRMGVLRQDLSLDDAQIILDLAMMGDAETWKLQRERDRMLAANEADGLADLELALKNAGGYTLESRAGAILTGLGIPATAHRQALSTLSGGFKLRVLLAQVLLGGPDILLLDEPTNHLDILSIRWLEKFLAGYRGTALVISHDQRFLDNVVTHVLDVDYGAITAYTGNYQRFAQEKQAIRERKETEVARAEKIIAEKRAFVDRFGAKATKAKQAQSRLKQIEKIEVEELADTSRREPLFRFVPERQSGKDVLGLEMITKAYGEKHVLRGVTLTIRRGEKVGIIGSNGLGKSTLLKIAVGELDADAGKVKFGIETKVGYFAQDHHDLLPDVKVSPLDYVWDARPSEATSAIRGQLGRMLFSGDDVTKPIGKLSGGEAARLIFARIIVQRPNVLVLDEPTNHLDMEAIGALIEGLKQFEGTVVFVSHDRHFVSELATRIVEITPQGVRDMPGTYAEYLQQQGDDHLDADNVVLKAKTERNKDTAQSNAPKGLSWEEQKKRKNRLASLPKKRDKIVTDLEAAELRKKAIQQLYAEPTFYTDTKNSEIERLDKESKDVNARIDTLTAEWEAIETELAQLQLEGAGA